MFEQPEMALEPEARASLTVAVLACPEGRARLRRRLAELAAEAFQPDGLSRQVDAVLRLLKPVEPLMEAPAVAVRERILARARFVQSRLKTLGARPESV